MDDDGGGGGGGDDDDDDGAGGAAVPADAVDGDGGTAYAGDEPRTAMPMTMMIVCHLLGPLDGVS